MIEFSRGETFNKSYIAIPVTGHLFELVQTLNGHKNFYHLTIFFLGKIKGKNLPEIRDLMSSIPEDDRHLPIIPIGLGFSNGKNEAFILKVQNTDKLMQIRELFENSRFNNGFNNGVFDSHITIEIARYGQFPKYRQTRYCQLAEMNRNISPGIAELVGLYYRTGEGATAQLLSKKI